MPALRAALKSRRCLIPADGYFEWTKGADGGSDPWYLTLTDHKPFSFAGLWVENRTLGIWSCTILTTPAAKQPATIQHRMPAILAPDTYSAWLSAKTGYDEAIKILRFDLIADVSGHRVSRKLNYAKADSPELVNPI